MKQGRCACVLPLLLLALGAEAAPHRYAILIGNDAGDASEVLLHYAQSDAQRMAQTLTEVGGFAPEDVQVLAGATADSVRRSLIFLNSRMREDPDSALLFVFYSGHGDASALHLGGSRLELTELKALLRSSPAGVRVLVLDACRSGGLTSVKGGKPAPAFRVEVQNALAAEGTAFLTSSAAGEDSQESDALGASVFTHYLVSALLGAGDANGDGQVTLTEAFAYASERTTSQTLGSWAGVQHPSYRFDLSGRGDVVLSRPLQSAQSLGSLAFLEPGTYYVRRGSESGALVAEVLDEKGLRYLALAPGHYVVTQRFPLHLLQGELEVTPGITTAVRGKGLKRIDYAKVVRKGGTERASASSLFFLAGGRGEALGLGPPILAGVGARVDLSVLALELRATYGGSIHENRAVDLHTNELELTAGVLRAFDLGYLTLSVGLELGAAGLRQGYVDLRNPARYALGFELGPLVAAELPIAQRVFVRAQVRAPTLIVPQVADDGSTHLATPFTLEVMAGVGFYL